MKVFVSGSMDLDTQRLPLKLKMNLMRLKIQGDDILIGDACGVDHYVQTWLMLNHVRNVTVYHMGHQPRNNVGHWKTKEFYSELGGRDYWTVKDIEMSNDCDEALMFWNRRSGGTRANIARMEEMGKKSHVIVIA